MSINNVSAVSDALKYVNGMEVQKQGTNIVSDVKDSLFNPISLLFGANEVKNNIMGTFSGDTYQIKKIKDLVEPMKDVNKSVAKDHVGMISNTNALKDTNVVKQFKNSLSNLANQADIKAANKTANVEQKIANKAMKAAQKEATEELSEEALKKIGDDAINAARTNGTNKTLFQKAGSKLTSLINKLPFGEKITSTLSKASGSKFAKVLKGSGAVAVMAIEGIMGLFTEVIPAFQQGGVDSGLKQLGQTAIKTAGSGLGWAGGTAAASALGAAIGSIFPGVGTIIGGAVGTFIGGVVGSIIGGGIGKKIAGESEIEKLQNEQFETAAAQVTQDNAAMSELNTLVSQQVQTEIANGTADADTELMAQYVNSGAFTASTSLNANTAATNTTQYYNTDNTAANANTANTANTTSTYDYWTDAAQKAASGDTSIYNISDEELNELFNSGTSSSTTSSTSSSNLSDDDGESVNYFATA